MKIFSPALPLHQQYEDINYNERFYWIGRKWFYYFCLVHFAYALYWLGILKTILFLFQKIEQKRNRQRDSLTETVSATTKNNLFYYLLPLVCRESDISTLTKQTKKANYFKVNFQYKILNPTISDVQYQLLIVAWKKLLIKTILLGRRLTGSVMLRQFDLQLSQYGVGKS